MDTSTLFILAVLLAVFSFYLARGRSLVMSRRLGGVRHLQALPFYYGMQAALWCLLPALGLLVLWSLFSNGLIENMVLASLPAADQALPETEQGLVLNTIYNLAAGADLGEVEPRYNQAAQLLSGLQSSSQNLKVALVLLVGLGGALWGWLKVNPKLPARLQVEGAFRLMLLGCSSIAILTTLGIIFSVLFESIRFFQAVNIFDFLFGTHWSPQLALRADQAGSSGAFGAVPLFVGTLLISLLAMLVAVPVGLMSAIYLAEYANRHLRSVVKPLLEILAGIPTVVYGFFAALTVAPAVREITTAIDQFFGWNGAFAASSESALAAGLVMGVMIIPFVSSLSDDVITAVPQTLRDGSLALGATKSETIRQVIIPAALPGIVGGILLAVSRAIGETMIVVMAAGLAAKLTVNPLEAVTTITVQIVTILVGDQEFDSPKTLAAFALGLMLFVVTLTLNFIALHVVKKYREHYE